MEFINIFEEHSRFVLCTIIHFQNQFNNFQHKLLPIHMILRTTKSSISMKVMVLMIMKKLLSILSIYVESDLNLSNTSWCRRNANQLELAKHVVILGQGTLSFTHLDFDHGLVVIVSGECLGLLGRDGGVRKVTTG